MSTAPTAVQTLINQAFVRFARDVVTHTFVKKEGHGTYDYHAQGYKIRIVKDDGFPVDVPVTIFFQDSIEVASGRLNLIDQCEAKITSQLGDHLSTIAAILHGMLDRGEFTVGKPSVGVAEVMYRATFKDLLQKFNRLIVAPAYKQLPSGEYQWPIGEYTLAVILPESPKTTVIPFTIFINKSTTFSRGYFDMTSFEVTELICPPVGHAETILLPLSELVRVNDTEEMSPAWEASQAEEPPMVLITNNTPDISDEWVTWFCKRNPGTSYAKAIHAALTHLTTEARKLKAIVDKYSINRY